ncbi:MAG TPA: hypothetical protein VNZ58_04835 [Thermomicrobiales bacterium]|nr:hypothetical protein [Thermomicrobiales bacterium]
MTATSSNIRTARHVQSGHRPGAILCAFIFAILLSLPSFAIASGQESTPEATPSSEPTPSPSMPRLVLDLQELNDSGITGTVTLYDVGDGKTIVKFEVQGAGGNHPAHIHKGTCDDLTPESYKDLNNVDENGKSTTLVDVSLSDLLASDYAIDVHLAPNELGTLIACANIEGEPELPAGATPVASPEATPNSGVGGTIATETPSNPGTPVSTQAPVSQSSDGTSGAQPTEIAGQGGPTTTTTVPTGGDGTAGISGKGEPVDTSTLPQQAGVGTALAWPEGPALTTMLAMMVAAILLGTGGCLVRRGEHHTTTTPSRWTRLGI